MTDETALTKQQADKYLVLSRDIESLKDVVEANLGAAAGASAFDLEQIKIPTGGGLQWIMPDGSSRKTFNGVLCAWTPVRAYWPDPFAGGTPPQCSSPDGVTGYGDPGGKCADCPEAQWGTSIGSDGEPARGQACKSMWRMFVLLEERLLPVLITLPPTSIRVARQYMVTLTSAQLPYWQVVTEFGLTKAQTRDGIGYATATLRMVAALSDEQAQRVRAYARSVEGFLSAPVTSDEYADGEADLG